MDHMDGLYQVWDLMLRLGHSAQRCDAEVVGATEQYPQWFWRVVRPRGDVAIPTTRRECEAAHGSR